MLDFWPKIYDDELLYSVIARYKRRAGISLKKSIMEDLYGTKSGMVQMFFPLHLKKMSEMIGNNEEYAKKLIYENTMYKYYTKLLTKELSTEIFEAMIDGKDANIFTKFAIHNTELKNNRYLKYCPLCIKEDINKYGESYWRREHQITGVLFCKRHNITLRNSDVITSKFNNRYVCADDMDISFEDNYEFESFYKHNAKYIKMIEEINENEDRLILKQIKKFYIYKLKCKGYVTEGGSIKIRNITKDFIDFYPQKYLEIMLCDINKDDYQKNWISKFFSDKHNKPLAKHIMMLQFLESSISEMFEYSKLMPLDDKKSNLINIKKKRTIKSKKGKEVIDWSKKDKEMYERVKNAIDKILNKKGKPERITKLRIRKEIVEGNCTNPKLIKTNELINSSIESTIEFRIRKIKWAIEELNNNGDKLTINKVKIKAGLGNINEKNISLLINHEIEKYIKCYL